MPATVLQWLVVAAVTGLLVGNGTSLFLHGLFFMTDRTQAIPRWVQMIKADLANSYLSAQVSVLSGRGWWLPLLFLLPVWPVR